MFTGSISVLALFLAVATVADASRQGILRIRTTGHSQRNLAKGRTATSLDNVLDAERALQEMFAYPQLSMGDFSMAPLSMVMSLSMPGLAIPFTSPAPSAQNSVVSQEEMPVPSPSPGIFVATPTTAPSVFPSSASTNTGDTNAVETNANDARSEDSSGLSKGGRTATIVILVAAAAMAAGFLAYRRQKGSSASGASVTSSLLSGGVNDVAPAV